MCVSRWIWNGGSGRKEHEDDAELERLAKERKRKLIDACLNPLWERATAECFGGGEYGRQMAKLITRINSDQPLDDLLKAKSSGHTTEVQPDQTESNQMKSQIMIKPQPHHPKASLADALARIRLS